MACDGHEVHILPGLALLMSISSGYSWYISERSGGVSQHGDYSDEEKVGSSRSQEIGNISFSFFYSQTYCPYLFIIPSSFASAVSRGGTVRVGNATTAVTEVLKTEQLAAV